MIFFIILSLFLQFDVVSSASLPSLNSSQLLMNMSHDYFWWKLKEFPFEATLRGIHDFDDRFADCSLDAVEYRKIYCEGLLEKMKLIDLKTLKKYEQINYACLKNDLKTYIEGYKWRLYGYLNPLNSMAPIFSKWVFTMRFQNKEDYKKYIKRLKAFSKWMRQLTELLKLSVKLNRTNHISSMRRFPDYVYNSIDFLSPIIHFRKPNMSSSVWRRIKKQVLKLTNEDVKDAFGELKSYLKDVYMKSLRVHPGVGQFKNGLGYYNAILKYHLSKDYSAAEIRDIGLREVERISKLMKDIMKKDGFDGSILEYIDYLKTDRYEELYGRNEDQLLQDYEDVLDFKIFPALHKVIDNVPEYNSLRVRPMPFADVGAKGSYHRKSKTFYVNVQQPELRPKYIMKAVALHEGYPGHHLQHIFHDRRMPPLPSFRDQNWYTASAGPTNFPKYSAYIEGWGLYSEFLGEEMGIYNESSDDLFGRYSAEIFRACRLVVDTGLHAFNMSREEAITYLQQYSDHTVSDLESEVDRYITWPGQATAYKIGEMEIQRLRKIAEEKLGNNFSIQQFHEEILNLGSVSLSVLEEHITRWIDDRPV